ncbi:transglycosylase domain-containing protein [Albibacterium profundi]|uniref:Transglycosylase domain-containing protein n=1 Tax=Albibacterium profundi TaxID=3134906 RepID=A0ABV5CC67_9SPHI
MQRKTKTDKLTKDDVKRYTRNFWKLIIGAIALGFLFILSVRLGLFGPLPSFKELENPKNNLSSEVISADGKVLGSYFAQNRSNVTYEELSPNLINALISTEDIRFYTHSGIDFKRTFTIIFYNLVGKRQGASTITQQLALNLFSEGRARNTFKRIIQKFQEWITAVRLERNYTKEEIITMYFNTVDFGAYNTYGIKSAARTYFSTTPAELSPEQAAVLVGMLKGTTLYSPIKNPKNSFSRRNTVLENMRKAGFISREEADELKAKPLVLAFNPVSYGEGLAPYFRATLKEELKKIFSETSRTKADGTPYDLDRDGLKIYTTIDSRMQRYAEEAQKEWLQQLQQQFNREYRNRDPFAKYQVLLDQGVKQSGRYWWLKQNDASEDEITESFNTPTEMSIFSWKGEMDTVMTPMDSIRYHKLILRNSLMSMEPQTGHVKAWVGGIDFKHFKYDQVKVGTRQVGSTAKPFTYAVAIDNGYSPCYQVPNRPITIGNWTPRGRSIGSPITLRRALAHSQNFATVDIMQQVGPVPVANLIRNMGITSPDLKPVPSISLGSFDASLYDMVGAYSTFVNHGIWTEPTYVLRVEDRNGAVIYEHNPKISVVLNEQTAYAMVDMLRSVVDEGSGHRIRWMFNFTNPQGGKTGTTNNNSDAWYIGITPDLVTGVWTGAENRAISFSSTAIGQGANAALPVYALYLQRVYADKELHYTQGDFELPKNGLQITLDCNEYTDQFYQGQEEEETVEDRLGF